MMAREENQANGKAVRNARGMKPIEVLSLALHCPSRKYTPRGSFGDGLAEGLRVHYCQLADLPLDCE